MQKHEFECQRKATSNNNDETSWFVRFSSHSLREFGNRRTDLWRHCITSSLRGFGGHLWFGSCFSLAWLVRAASILSRLRDRLPSPECGCTHRCRRYWLAKPSCDSRELMHSILVRAVPGSARIPARAFSLGAFLHNNTVRVPSTEQFLHRHLGWGFWPCIFGSF